MMETANLGDLNDRPLGHDGALDGTLLIERQMNVAGCGSGFTGDDLRCEID